MKHCQIPRHMFWCAAACCALALGGCSGEAPLTPLQKAEALLKEGQYGAAVMGCDALLAERPDDAAAHLVRGKAFLLLGQPRRALKDLDAAVAGAPTDSEGFYQRAVAYKELNETDKAIADERQARKLDPNYSRAFLYQKKTYSDEAAAIELSHAASKHHDSAGEEKAGQGDSDHSSQRSDARHASKREILGEEVGDETDHEIELLRQTTNSEMVLNGSQTGKKFADKKKTERSSISRTEEPATTVQDVYGQPLILDRRSQTEQMLGIRLPKTIEALQPTTHEAAADNTRAGRANRGGYATLDDPSLPSELTNAPRLTPQTSTAIAPPLQGGGGAAAAYDGIPGPGVGEPPLVFPNRSPYASRMRSTGLQDPDVPPRSANPYGGGAGVSTGLGNRPLSPYSTPVQAGGRRDLSGGSTPPVPISRANDFGQ